MSHITGTINSDETDRFQKLIFRATRGNALTYFVPFKQDIEDYHGLKVAKSVYLVLFQNGTILGNKVARVCDSFVGHRFELPQGGLQ